MDPSREPQAAEVLHKLGRKFTKMHMGRLGSHSYCLHPYMDDLGMGTQLHSK